MPKIAAALALLILAGCSDSTSLVSVPFQLSITTPTMPGAPAPQFTGTSGAIVVRARFVTPTPCFDLGAGVTQSGSTVDVTITSTERNVTCVQSLGTFDYTLTISPVAPGPYHIIVHHVGEASFSNTSFTGDVTVP